MVCRFHQDRETKVVAEMLLRDQRIDLSLCNECLAEYAEAIQGIQISSIMTIDEAERRYPGIQVRAIILDNLKIYGGSNG